MSFTCQITQLAKSQALDLLDRVLQRLVNEANELRDGDEARGDAIMRLSIVCHDIERMVTNLDREAPLTITDLAYTLRHADDNRAYRGHAVEYFATYLSNLNVNQDEFFLAAGYPLRECYQLLRECVHGVDTRTEVCFPCDTGTTDGNPLHPAKKGGY